MNNLINNQKLHQLQKQITAHLFQEENISNLDHKTINFNFILENFCSNELEKTVLLNHMFNAELWSFEDAARDTQASDQVIADIKRSIDRLNQQRNDQIEIINNWFWQHLSPMNESAVLNTETPGSVLDRLSILALKIYHMDEQAHRNDVSSEHRETCQKKVKILIEQAEDLCKALDSLITEIVNKKRRFKLYYQMKMYNDPTLNPYLHKK